MKGSILAISLMAVLILSLAQSTASVNKDKYTELTDELAASNSAKLRIANHSLTQKVMFMAIERPAVAVNRLSIASQEKDAEQESLEFLKSYGELFGLDDAGRQLKTETVKSEKSGRSSVRFQQVHSGIPVFGGELITNLDSAGELASVSGEILPDINLDVNPLVSSKEAEDTALSAVAKWYGGEYQVDVDSLKSTKPELWIYNPILLGVNRN